MSVDLTGKTVYLAGPMRGHPGRNLRAHIEAADALRRMGAARVTGGGINAFRRVTGAEETYQQTPLSQIWGWLCNAAEIEGLSPAQHIDKWLRSPDLSECMGQDLPDVCRADVVVALPGWEASDGTRQELFNAALLDIPILEYPALTPINAEALACALAWLVNARRMAGTRREAVAAVKGKYSHVSTSADEYLARKHGEETR